MIESYPGGMDDPADPNSLLNLMSDRMRTARDVIPKGLWDRGEAELSALFKPAVEEILLRQRFWEAVERCYARRKVVEESTDGRALTEKSRSKDPLRISDWEVYHGICNERRYYKVLEHPSKLAWLLCPPTTFRSRVEAFLSMGYSRIAEILAAPIVVNGVLHVKAATLIAKIVNDLENRYFGAAVQRKLVKAEIDVRGAAEAQLQEKIATTNFDELDSKIEKLQRQLAEHRTPKPAAGGQMFSPEVKEFLEGEILGDDEEGPKEG